MPKRHFTGTQIVCVGSLLEFSEFRVLVHQAMYLLYRLLLLLATFLPQPLSVDHTTPNDTQTCHRVHGRVASAALSTTIDVLVLGSV